VFESTRIQSEPNPEVEISIRDVQKPKPEQMEYLSRKEIMTLHQTFILLARNRSDFLKMRSQNKYRIRGKFDDNIRCVVKLLFLDQNLI
jgi:hypothetical protein